MITKFLRVTARSAKRVLAIV